jgi:SAM-dependent methyltransferase
MFFPEKITLPQPTWKVLEIGPGSTPHPRANAFLELHYDNDEIKLRQRGGTRETPEFGSRPVHTYEGEKFPFSTNEFDYVICSHVLEHVPEPKQFMTEIFRVGSGKGYIEYPLLPYEYLYDFDVHVNVVKYSPGSGALYYAKKSDLLDIQTKPVRDLLRSSLERGWNETIDCNKQVFFEGVEFDKPFDIRYESTLACYLDDELSFDRRTFVRYLLHGILRKVRL